VDKLETVVQAIHGQTTQQLVESAQQSRETRQPALQPPEMMDWLWQMMGSMFGHKWVSSFGPEVDPDRVWASCLKGISKDQIKFGLNRCALTSREWPPSAPEFRGMCLDEQDWEHKRIAAADADWQKTREEMLVLEDVTRKERIREAKEREMAKMKSLWGK
jgi:hypothetical protein